MMQFHSKLYGQAQVYVTVLQCLLFTRSVESRVLLSYGLHSLPVKMQVYFYVACPRITLF